jgi:Reverse transcriptase (RNA-dependent DNA polymerase)
MPMGLCSAPATFQRMMDVVLRGLKWSTCFVYLDIIVYSRTFDEHVKGLMMVLDRLRGANSKVQLGKCEFAQPQLKALGHLIDKQGISPAPEKVKAAWEFPRPPMEGSKSEKLKALRAFLLYLSYYRRFINGFAVLAKPLHELVGTKGA